MSTSKTIHSQFKTVLESTAEFKLPRYNELPDFELYMDQVINVMEKYLSLFVPLSDGKLITPSIINNYVKLKIIPAPKAKKYSKEHLAYLIVICILKQTLSIKLISDMINIGLISNELPDLYNNFCDNFEGMLLRISKESEEFIDLPTEQLYNAYLSLTMRSAASSSIGRFICENVVKFNEDKLKG